MIQVRIATKTIRMNRIVYADGRLNPRFLVASTGSAVAVAVIPVLLQFSRSAGGSAADDAGPVGARDEAADLGERPDCGPVAGPLGEVDRGLDLGAHRAGGEGGALELGCRGFADPGLVRPAPVAVDAVDVGGHHEQVGVELPGEERRRAVLVDDDLRPDERPRAGLVHRRDPAAT